MPKKLKPKGVEKERSLRKRIIGLRLSDKEYEQIANRCKQSNANKISEYLRHILFNKPITIDQRDKSLDDFMAEMMLLRNELNGIGNNFNQAVRKLHSLQQIAEFKSWIITSELEKKILLNKIDEIKNRINKIARQMVAIIHASSSLRNAIKTTTKTRLRSKWLFASQQFIIQKMCRI